MERINHGESAISFLGNGGGVDAVISGGLGVRGYVTDSKARLHYLRHYVCDISRRRIHY